MKMDFTQWTREDYKAFDAQRAKVFEQTEEELQEQAERMQNYKKEHIEYVKSLLSKYDIIFTGEETDFSSLYQSYIKGGGSLKNEPMNEWLGDDTELDKVYKDKIKNGNNLESFVAFVNQYEN